MYGLPRSAVFVRLGRTGRIAFRVLENGRCRKKGAKLEISRKKIETRAILKLRIQSSIPLDSHPRCPPDRRTSRKVFPMTVRLESSMAVTAQSGVRSPLMAMGMASKL